MQMNYYGYTFISDSDLAHHGIKGQKWGIRRFQNKDGSLERDLIRCRVESAMMSP